MTYDGAIGYGVTQAIWYGAFAFLLVPRKNCMTLRQKSPILGSD